MICWRLWVPRTQLRTIIALIDCVEFSTSLIYSLTTPTRSTFAILRPMLVSSRRTREEAPVSSNRILEPAVVVTILIRMLPLLSFTRYEGGNLLNLSYS